MKYLTEQLIADAANAVAAQPHADEDGHCTRCGLEFEDNHECPPGFTTPLFAAPKPANDLTLLNTGRAIDLGGRGRKPTC